jgi:hypothetical protein
VEEGVNSQGCCKGEGRQRQTFPNQTLHRRDLARDDSNGIGRRLTVRSEARADEKRINAEVACPGARVKTPYRAHGRKRRLLKTRMNQTAFRAHWKRLCSILFKGRTSCGTLRVLIREDESAVGYDRNDIRAKAKKWLIAHGSSLTAEDILLARDHFGYLLPMGWGD